MKKSATQFVCSECGNIETKWLGRCPQCGNWNTFTEQRPVTAQTRRAAQGDNDVSLQQLMSVEDVLVDKDFIYTSNISEFDRVLGGAIMHGSATLIGGEPGIGKSTLMLQVVASLTDKKAIYVSGEESPQQVKKRAQRLSLPLDRILLFSNTNLESLIDIINKEKPDCLVVDSLQTLTSSDLTSASGSVSQMKNCASDLVDVAKAAGCALFLVGHVTKDGQIAGPKVVEHIVDTVLYFEMAETGARIIRAAKNRFGSIDEIGIFIMGEKGLVPVSDPAGFFLSKRPQGTIPPGISFGTVLEGSRTFLIEIQALSVPLNSSGYPRIFSEKVDSSTVSRIAAILERHAGVVLSRNDIYVNVAGGIKVKEVAIELPLALALYSALTGRALPANLVSMGELSLAGEVRPVGFSDKRMKGALEMGYSTLLIPSSTKRLARKATYLSCETIAEALEQVTSIHETL